MQQQPITTSYGSKIIEGKTKIVYEYPDDAKKVLLVAKDAITAFNTKRDVIEGKSRIATNTTCNVFRFLKACGLPVAFDQQINETTFIAPYCSMILYEVVVRREAHGSFLKRHPYLKKGHVFPELVLEFFLKTSNCEWKGVPIPADDPYIIFEDHKAKLYRPDAPTWQQEPFMQLDEYPLVGQDDLLRQMGILAKKTFFALEKAWQNVGSKLVDFKIEFGLDGDGNLLIADVIDNDSWRVVHDGAYIDKQYYRDGGTLDEVKEKYEYVEQRTRNFTIPKQQIIIWRGSVQDEVDDVVAEIHSISRGAVDTMVITCSIHKDPVTGYQELAKQVQHIPSTVLLAFIGRSNGAGPTLSANTFVPVITIPVGWEKFPDDVWSSLRAPSNVPVMTILDKKNACLAALQILAQSNPRLSMDLQERRIGHARNVVLL